MSILETYRRELGFAAAGALAAITLREVLVASMLPDGFTASVVVAFFACVALVELFDQEDLKT